EVAGDGAVQVTPEDAEELAEAMIGLWRDAERRAELAARGPARATHFDRERWIGRMFEIYRSLLAGA
ncbi:MAG TPA: glycosyltransferase family 1 protein, partial [Candidatus Eisenbacteria bacterium]